jgi:hypothetical protein
VQDPTTSPMGDLIPTIHALEHARAHTLEGKITNSKSRFAREGHHVLLQLFDCNDLFTTVFTKIQWGPFHPVVGRWLERK